MTTATATSPIQAIADRLPGFYTGEIIAIAAHFHRNGNEPTHQTDLTEVIYGTSGRGSPVAVAHIKLMHSRGLLLARAKGRTTWLTVADLPGLVAWAQAHPGRATMFGHEMARPSSLGW